MIRSPLGLRLGRGTAEDTRARLRGAGALGAKGVVFDATGPLSPRNLGETARRELRHILRTTELSLIALHLPTRRPFDRDDGLDDRVARADRAFELAYDLGSRICLLNIGAIPPSDAQPRRSHLMQAITLLARRAEHRGVRLAIEAGEEQASDLADLIASISEPRPVVSIDPGAFATRGEDPAFAVRALGGAVVHSYATLASESKQTPTDRPGLRRPMTMAVDWEDYMGALEEVAYRGFVTIWPEPGDDAATQFRWFESIFARF